MAVSSSIFKSLVWVNLGLNPSLQDHSRTFYWLAQNKIYQDFIIYQTLQYWNFVVKNKIV